MMFSQWGGGGGGGSGGLPMGCTTSLLLSIRIFQHFHGRVTVFTLTPPSPQSAFPYCGWCSSGSERVCTTVDQCDSERTWRSPYDNCPPLARFRTQPQDRTVTLTESNAVVEVDLMCESEGGATPSWSRLRSVCISY